MVSMNTLGRFDAASVARRRASKSEAARVVGRPCPWGSLVVVGVVAAAGVGAANVFNFGCSGLVDVGVLVGAEQNLFAAGYISVALGRSLADSALHRIIGQTGFKSALLLNFEEELPRFAGDGHGEGLHIVAAAGRIDHFVEMALLFEEELLVAGNALGKFVGALVGGVEGVTVMESTPARAALILRSGSGAG